MSPPRHGIIRAETDTWQPIGFQFKESKRSNAPFRSASFFAYRTSHLLQHFLFTWCPHDQAARAALKPSLPARLSAPDTPCSGSSHRHSRGRFQGGHCLH